MRMGRYLRIACVCCTEGSSEFGGAEICRLAYWEATRSTGSTRYFAVSSQPMGGAPLTNGTSQLRPSPESCCSIVAGPPSEGMKKKPSFSRPSCAASVSALQS